MEKITWKKTEDSTGPYMTCAAVTEDGVPLIGTGYAVFLQHKTTGMEMIYRSLNKEDCERVRDALNDAFETGRNFGYTIGYSDALSDSIPVEED